jgi:serine/threonine-protein kinase
MNGYVSVGEVIAEKYRVDRVLGVGGMGMVVAATHVDLGQQVAIKVMLPQRDRNAVVRFHHEAQAVARMRSEHVCRVFDVGTHLGRPFMVLELLDGQDLAQVLARQRRLPVGDAIDCIVQILDALAEAHAHGIVHRDLKPSNIFVTTGRDGSAMVKLIDFGVAKSATSITRTGIAIGTPAYMAPEQMSSARAVDARADLWAIGVIAYEAITGANPFVAETIPGMVIRAMQYDPPVIPGGFGAVVMRCLAKDPDRRFGSAAELAEALAPFGSPSTSHLARKIARASGVLPVAHPTTLQGAARAVSAPPVPLRRTHLAGAAALAVGVGLAIALLVPHRAQPAPAIQASAPVVLPIAPTATAPAPRPAVEPAVEPLPPSRITMTVRHEPPKLPAARRASPTRVGAPSETHVSVARGVDRALLDPSLPDALTLEMIATALADAQPAIEVCVKHLAEHGTVGLYVAISPTGEVASITAQTPHTALGKCVADAIRDTPFTATSTGGFFHRDLAL